MQHRLFILAAYLSVPFAIWLVLYYLATHRKLPLKPLLPWLWTVPISCFGISLFYDVSDNHKVSSVFRLGFWSMWMIVLWIKRRAMFTTISCPGSRWFRAGIELPRDIHIAVKDIETLSPWYTEKLGLRRLAETSTPEKTGSATFKFTEDGKSITLDLHSKMQIQPTPMFLTRKIEKLKVILQSRGIVTGDISKDRQGTRFFEMHDPEGNAIEVVEG